MSHYLLSIMKGQDKSLTARLITLLLLPLSWLYGWGVFWHRSFYNLIGAYKAPKPVISVGNVTVGGAGKTPLVIWLARHLQDKGLKSIILIRGYMPKASEVSDEVDMINEQIPYIPVLAGSNRIANIRESEEVLPADFYICDDAFQHWPLGRDLDIVVIDSSNPFGNGHLLPAGTLREPLSALKRAHVFVITKTSGRDLKGLTDFLIRINYKALIVESYYKSSGPVNVFGKEPLPEDFLRGKRAVGFCAIGDPRSFESSLKNAGADIARIFFWHDHHVYQKDDIRQLVETCRLQKAEVLVTTHKDAVKLKNFKEMLGGLCLVYIPIQLEIAKGSDALYQKIISVCRR